MQKRLIFRLHAIQRMFQRSISDQNIREVLNSGLTIENYLSDIPYPSRLILGWINSRSLHVVIADNIDDDAIIIITAYEPELDQWEPGFQRRKT